MSETDDYTIGYRKPPRHSQFRKGQSGNPGGRRRSLAANAHSALASVLARRVTVAGEEGEARDFGMARGVESGDQQAGDGEADKARVGRRPAKRAYRRAAVDDLNGRAVQTTFPRPSRLRLSTTRHQASRNPHVRPLQMGHHQAQEGRARRQARQDLHEAHSRAHHCREDGGG